MKLPTALVVSTIGVPVSEFVRRAIVQALKVIKAR
jgi:hypothetical protein